MKKFKSIIAVFLSMIIVGSLATSLSASAASRRILRATIEPQNNKYYCGVCALQSLLKRETNVRNEDDELVLNPEARGRRSQGEVASLIYEKSGWSVDDEGETAWFTWGNDPGDRSRNPLCCTLQRSTSVTWQITGGNTGKPYSPQVVREKIKNSIDMGHCVLANGDTGYYDDNRNFIRNKNYYVYRTMNFADTSPSNKMWYADTDGHWVIIDGYEANGNVFRIKDSGYRGTGCFGFPSDSYYVTLMDLCVFISCINTSHGIIFCEKNSK